MRHPRRALAAVVGLVLVCSGTLFAQVPVGATTGVSATGVVAATEEFGFGSVTMYTLRGILPAGDGLVRGTMKIGCGVNFPYFDEPFCVINGSVASGKITGTCADGSEALALLENLAGLYSDMSGELICSSNLGGVSRQFDIDLIIAQYTEGTPPGADCAPDAGESCVPDHGAGAYVAYEL